MGSKFTRQRFLTAVGASATYLALANTLGCELAKRTSKTGPTTTSQPAQPEGAVTYGSPPASKRGVWAFRSRPDLSPPAVEMAKEALDDIAPGYIFVAPKKGDAGQGGSMILDNGGQPVWLHLLQNEDLDMMNFRVQTYKGETVLTWWEGYYTGYGQREYVIFDGSYREIARLPYVRWTTDYFQRQGIETPRLDAELLLAHALETERLRLYVDFEKPVLPAERDRFRELVRQRAALRVPVSILLGEREFWSLSFKVTKDVLTPRPDTETLVEAALAKCKGPGQGVDAGEPSSSGAKWKGRILDLGTGSGAIALSLGSELPEADITATDLSEAALQIAAENADRLPHGEKIRFLYGDLFGPVANERFDLVVSNPPYVARRDAQSLPPELAHEPEMALFAGEDGLDVIRRLVAGAGSHLSPGGWLLIELSPEQAGTVEQMLAGAGFVDLERRFDLARRPRVVGGRWPGA